MCMGTAWALLWLLPTPESILKDSSLLLHKIKPFELSVSWLMFNNAIWWLLNVTCCSHLMMWLMSQSLGLSPIFKSAYGLVYMGKLTGVAIVHVDKPLDTYDSLRLISVYFTEMGLRLCHLGAFEIFIPNLQSQSCEVLHALNLSILGFYTVTHHCSTWDPSISSNELNKGWGCSAPHMMGPQLCKSQFP